jgi:hypothetical protein
MVRVLQAAVGRHREAATTAPSHSSSRAHGLAGHSSLAASLRAQVVSATLHQTESLETIVSYSIELACGPRRWSVERRYSEFARLHSDLGHDAPTADIFAFTHAYGPMLGFIATRRYQPELVEARLTALDEWLTRACTALEFDSRLGRFLAMPCAEIDAFRDWAQRREGAAEPRPCVLCSAGVPCEFSEEVSAARRDAANAPSPEARAHGGKAKGVALPHEGYILRVGCSPDSVIAPAGQAGVAAPCALLALRHAHGYEPTAEALAHQLCALTRMQRTQHGGGGGLQGPSAPLSLAEARRFVEHCCLIHGAAHGQPGRVLARFHPTVMVCALTYLKRLAAVTKAPTGAEVGGGGSPAAAAVSAAAAEKLGEGAELLASLLAGDGWQVALLATLVLVTKTYSDFADCLVTNAVLCDKRSGLRAGWPLCTGARLVKAEHDLLHLLDFRTIVSTTELFDVGSVAQNHSRENLGKYYSISPEMR